MSKQWIIEELIPSGIVSDVLNTNGFKNLHLTCVLQLMIKTLKKNNNKNSKSIIYENTIAMKSNVFVELLKDINLSYDERYDSDSKIKFDNTEDVKLMF